VIIAAIITTVGAIVVAVITAYLGRKVGLKQGIEKGETAYKQRVISAPEKYVEHLDRLINEAIAEGVENAVINARAIVAARNDLRDSLLTIAHLLNSEITTLQRELDERPFEEFIYKNNLESYLDRDRSQSVDVEYVYETIQVLAKKWPAKRDQIKYAIRKVIAELGLDSLK
jgi:hypothetical protein